MTLGEYISHRLSEEFEAKYFAEYFTRASGITVQDNEAIHEKAVDAAMENLQKTKGAYLYQAVDAYIDLRYTSIL